MLVSRRGNAIRVNLEQGCGRRCPWPLSRTICSIRAGSTEGLEVRSFQACPSRAILRNLLRKKPRPVTMRISAAGIQVPELLGTLRCRACAPVSINQARSKKSVCLQLLIVTGGQKVRSRRETQAQFFGSASLGNLF